MNTVFSKSGPSRGDTPDKARPVGAFPVIMGEQMTREQIIEGLREMYNMLVQREKDWDGGFVGWPDLVTILDYIEEHGLPPKNRPLPCPTCGRPGWKT
jgi:hypothetical protein